MTDLRSFVRDVPDFPEPGIVFRDITPLLAFGHSLDITVRKVSDPAVDARLPRRTLREEAKSYALNASGDDGAARDHGKALARPKRPTRGTKTTSSPSSCAKSVLRRRMILSRCRSGGPIGTTSRPPTAS